ncbi:MAG: dihydrolipoyl dehydrogenase [Lentisphaerae bacterium]|jgi:dihydrolipoamide dehydrogenase|nr:dihydrolipoyl dehydrogenase [Lentisphaerota bacterium]MBT4817525.1 dihydrolipoyl dehydrogenase [Lentisphaerota bacterium]MBT5604990.1 dihydrolipoyl dehydrogenase [Lentisphaerota bacterium]MBT7054620.1 dihydrolipoyl dehydrogenase [Lentisphaerota bacterium]MBT7844649.1 dihydrolipoyl dehydrogenase [Lentisphaerota bacterium]
MSTEKPFDVCIIGAGPGGYVAAIRSAQLGLRVALVEKGETLGGTCLNVGCIPSKALLESSRLYTQMRDEGALHGIRADGLTVDIEAMMARKQGVVNALASGVRTLVKENGVALFQGTARLVGPNEIDLSAADGASQRLMARNFVLATGSVPTGLPNLPFDGTVVVDSTAALSFECAPSTLVVVGGGAVGLEMASLWSRLGTDVHVVELMPRLLPGMDSQLGTTLGRCLKRQGITIRTGTAIVGIKPHDGGAILMTEGRDGHAGELPAEKVLVAVGRRPFAGDLGFDAVGVEVDEKSGGVTVDERFMTSCPGVYAIGDLIGGPMLAHKAEDEGMAVAEILAGKPGFVNYSTIPSVVYTWPEVAAVGRTEDQLKEQNVDYVAGVFPFKANGRAFCAGEQDGMAKVLADVASDRILGVHVIGPHASELIAEAVCLMEFGGSAEDLARTVHAHPTLSEAVREAALAVAGRAIHARGQHR